MVGVAALVEAMHGAAAFERIAIGTTRWVTDDTAADVQGLVGEVSPGLALLAANLDFAGSRHSALQAYEQGMVKEGVGAGGAAIAAVLATGHSIERLEEAIDEVYDELLGRLI
jgi:NaMN:DMB phosphoribosyltransferase